MSTSIPLRRLDTLGQLIEDIRFVRVKLSSMTLDKADRQFWEGELKRLNKAAHARMS
jgi:hypothetical protein